MRWHTLRDRVNTLCLICVLSCVWSAPAAADFTIAENYNNISENGFPFGFSLFNSFGWWNPGDGATTGQITNNHPPSTASWRTERIANNPSLPSNFPLTQLTPIEGEVSMHHVIYARPFTVDPTLPDLVTPNTFELNLGLTDATDTGIEGRNVVQYDDASPSVRGQATLSLDYRLSTFAPSTQAVPVGPPPNRHPSDPDPYNVYDGSADPVFIRFAFTYRDMDQAGSPCTGCWQVIGASRSTNPADPGLPDVSDPDFLALPPVGAFGVPTRESAIMDTVEEFELIADGQVHSLEVPIEFLTADERLSLQWRGGEAGLPGAPGDPNWQIPDIIETLRYQTRGGSPNLLTIDNISLTALISPEGLSGDYNDDDVVDAADYTVWRNKVGQPADTLPNRDPANAATTVDTTHYADWKTNFGNVLGSGSGGLGSPAVPEPTSVSLVVLALLAIGAANSRRK